MKKVLVAGGAGFIGSHLCEFLLSKGCHVTCVDNFITGQKKNIAGIKSPNFKFVEADITQSGSWSEGQFEEIYNLASPASPIDFEKIPLKILECSSLGHRNLLELARKNDARILFASTSEVYGDPEVHPQRESYFGNVNTVGIRGCYDEAKRFGEALSMAYHRQFGTKIRLIRIFNTYGPRMRETDGRIIPNFFMQGLNGESLTIYGEGQQTRSFCYVADMCEGMYALVQSEETRPVNIGNPTELTVLEMAETVKKLTGNTKPFAYKPLPENDPKMRRPDIARAKDVLKWQPRVSLEQGLDATLKYFKSQL